ncbi:hypothetical protein B0H66DRAFT_593533 [Apodospora peruviana]|uniref:Uncharacterized protein n=1 Tax=Apodospora peruviana TaxID=516989 RepID=A0AAE0HXQ3_9PEZI|nr:hypothetical protein B0H66DRAFT_593533 [Apodospora peruviana]
MDTISEIENTLPIVPPTSSSIRHDNHWDEIVPDDVIVDWLHDGPALAPEEYITNESLYKNERLGKNDVIPGDWMAKLASLRPERVPDLIEAHNEAERFRKRYVWDPARRIPLCTDEEGREYQIKLSLSASGLDMIDCPEFTAWGRFGDEEMRCVLFGIRDRLPYRPPSSPAKGGGMPELPKLAASLGYLEVGTIDLSDGLMSSVSTDYEVIMDVGSDDMPLWIMAPQQCLKDRAMAAQRSVVRPLVPIFRRMMDDGGCLYDVACILSSVRKLGGRVSYAESCELVSKTRAVIDPACVVALGPEWM